jgi:hypothetical protein
VSLGDAAGGEVGYAGVGEITACVGIRDPAFGERGELDRRRGEIGALSWFHIRI